MAGLIYDREKRRLGPLIRGHLLMFDRREVPKFSTTAGLLLLAIFLVFELALGPRLEHLTLLAVAVPEPLVRLPIQIAAALVLVRLVANVRWRHIGFVPFTQWTATETLYFLQVVLIAGGVFWFLFLRALPIVPGPMQAAGLIIVTQLMWGFYQELMYRGVLQTTLSCRFGALWGALVANIAFTFGPLHFYYFSAAMPDVNKAISLGIIFAVGLFFAYIFARTRNIWIVGIFHGIGNVFTNGGPEIQALLR